MADDDGRAPRTRTYLETRLGEEPPTRALLVGPRAQIGRIPTLEVVLDHPTVSRRHAEIARGADGRWTLRDLGSRSGTLVNGARVTESPLAPGVPVGIGAYVVRLVEEALPARSAAVGDSAVRSSQRPSAMMATMGDAGPSVLARLADFAPPNLTATQLRTLLDLGRELLAAPEEDARLEALLRLMVGEAIHAKSAVVLWAEGAEASVRAGPLAAGGAASTEPPYISRGVLRAVIGSKEPVLASNDPRAKHAQMGLTMGQDVRAMSIVACPLGGGGPGAEAPSVLYVTLPPQYGTPAWLALVTLATETYAQAEVAWRARRAAQVLAATERELEVARDIQRRLLPRDVRAPGLDVAVRFEAAAWIGGDYVDAAPMPDGRWLFAVADVCGKGVQAALVTFSVHTSVRAAAAAGQGLLALGAGLEETVRVYLPELSFVTFAAAAVDPASGEVELLVCGHPPPFRAGDEGGARVLEVLVNPALGIGIAPDRTSRFVLAKGASLILYTDGLTEQRGRDGTLFGEARACAALDAAAARDAAGLADALDGAFEAFRRGEPRGDDTAFVAIRLTG